MKKLLVVAAALMMMVPALSSAQGLKMTQSEFNKAGKISISGDILTFDNVKNEDADEGPTNMGLAPEIGYMVMDNLQVNFGLGYMSESEGDNEMSGWMIAPGVRYYLDMLSKNNLFPSVGASYMMGSMSAGDTDTDMSDIRVGAGITQAMGGAQGGHMSLMLDYTMQTMKMGDIEAKSAGIDVGVKFGLYF